MWNFGGKEGFKSGDIKMSYGSIADVLARNPGWVLCDGTLGTPDLRNRFIVGADADDGGIAKTTITGTALQTGGTTQHTHGVTVSVGGSLSLGNKLPNASPSGSWDIVMNSIGGGSSTSQTPTALVSPFYALAFIMKL